MLTEYVLLSIIIFVIGVLGIILNRKNIIVILMSIELTLLAINMNYIVLSVMSDDLIGQVGSIIVLTVAAAESAIGLAILVAYYRIRGTIAVLFINLMKG